MLVMYDCSALLFLIYSWLCWHFRFSTKACSEEILIFSLLSTKPLLKAILSMKPDFAIKPMGILRRHFSLPQTCAFRLNGLFPPLRQFHFRISAHKYCVSARIPLFFNCSVAVSWGGPHWFLLIHAGSARTALVNSPLWLDIKCWWRDVSCWATYAHHIYRLTAV